MTLQTTIELLFNEKDGLLFELKEDDVDSIGTKNPTDLAKKIIQICKPYFVECNTYVFWSTRPARVEAYKLSDKKEYMLDKKHALINDLFERWSNISKTNKIDNKKMILISFAISRLYALQATNNALVFLGSDKSTEGVGFHVGNNLWHAELFVLRHVCKNIKFVIVDDNNTKTYDVTPDKLLVLPIWRREYHILDDPKTSKSFVKRSYGQLEYDQWRMEPPRKGITYGRLYEHCQKWRKYKKIMIEQRVI